MVKDNVVFSVKNKKAVGPNGISFELTIGQTEQLYVVGCYLPPITRRERPSTCLCRF